MRLTAADMESVAFRRVPLVRRGYDPEHVDAFVDAVARELSQFSVERTRLQAEVERLKQVALRTPSEPPRTGPNVEHAHVQAVRVLARAQQTADGYLADAHAYSRQLAVDARRRCEEMLAEARQHAVAIVDEARRRIVDSDDEYEDADTTTLRSRREELQRQVDYLRIYGQVCRVQLRTYLDALVRSIEEWDDAVGATAGSAGPAGAASPVPSPVAGAAPAGGNVLLPPRAAEPERAS